MDNKSSDNASSLNSSESEDSQQFLTFRVGSEEYGVSLMTIREIKGWSKPTHLPNSPKFMEGVINLRGVVIPIFDLLHRFEMGKTEPNEKNVIIIISINDRLIGALVDAVSDILTVSNDQIKPAPKLESKINEDYVDGLIEADNKMVVTLNIENLFDKGVLSQAETLANKADIPEEDSSNDVELNEAKQN